MRHRVTVVVCVCVFGSIFLNRNESARKTCESPQRCNRLIYNVGFFIKQPLCEDTEFKWQPYLAHESPQRCNRLIYNVGFFIKQPLCEDTEFKWQPYLGHRSAILLALADTQAYIRSRDVALDHVVFCYGLCHCVWCDAV